MTALATRCARTVALTALVVWAAGGVGRTVDRAAANKILDEAIGGAQTSADEVATTLSGLEAAPPPPPAPGQAGLNTNRMLQQARQDQAWLQNMVQQAKAQYQAAQNAKNDAERAVALKDAMLKAASAQQLSHSIQSSLDLVRGESSPRRGAVPPPAPRQPVTIRPGLLDRLRQAAESSQEGARAAAGGNDVRAFGWALDAFESTPTPGGILFSRQHVNDIVLNLRIDGVRIDPEHGDLVVFGPRTTTAVDMDLFATGMRLGLEKAQPYFSLEPVADRDGFAREWREVREYLFPRLNEAPYYLNGYPCAGRSSPVPWAILEAADSTAWPWSGCSSESRERVLDRTAFSKRFIASARRVRGLDGATYSFDSLEKLDPQLRDEVLARFKVGMALDFRPAWLRSTRVGEILFRADASIKELWTPGGAFTASGSRVLRVSGAKPFEIGRSASTRRSDSDGWQRWWFMPGGSLASAEQALELSDVIPRLHVVSAMGHHDTAEPIGEWTVGVIEDVNARFDEYSDAIPEWKELGEVFRAYVLGAWIREQRPQLAQRLLAELPEPRPASAPLPMVYQPLVMIGYREPTIVEDGNRVTWNTYGSWVRQGGVGFSRAELTTRTLNAAANTPPTTDTVNVRLVLPNRSTAGVAMVPAMMNPQIVEDELRVKYEAQRRIGPTRQGGVFGRIGGVVNFGEFVALVILCSGVAALLNRWKVELRWPS